jgi:signal transduction histidine kinase
MEATSNDTLKIKECILLTEYYRQAYPDSSYLFGEKLLALSQRHNFKLSQVYALTYMLFARNFMNRYGDALPLYLAAQALVEDPASEKNVLPNTYAVDENAFDHPQPPHLQRLEKLASLNLVMAMLYRNVKDSLRELEMLDSARRLAETCRNDKILSTYYVLSAIRYLALRKYDSVLRAERKAYELADRAGYTKYLGSILLGIGNVYKETSHLKEAIYYYRTAIRYSYKSIPIYYRGVVAAELNISELLLRSGQTDSSIYYANKALYQSQQLGFPDLKLRSYQRLAASYDSTNYKDSSIKYKSLIILYNDSANKSQVNYQAVLFGFREHQRQQEEIAIADRNRLQTYGFIAGLAAVLLIALILWNNNRRTKRANALLKEQKQETENQKAKVEQMYSTLKSTQALLIQAEKMASLGELTAGIAHEIQNPLNFVNNFSEVNNELIEEMNTEFKSGHSDSAFQLAATIKENSHRITEHGRRAEVIVKGMLQHSRGNSGQKEPSDINRIAEEHLRLSYNGVRAKDASFHANIITSFDPGLRAVEIVPQEIGRVLFNILNNAFYSVKEKKKLVSDGYEPTVWMKTEMVNSDVMVSVRDNGTGIPNEKISKIFQPFFTTKPAGEGTGLGLSLSYDIIKAHGGEINVESFADEGAAFSILLPYTT